MPILELRCDSCGESFEWLKLSAKDEAVCPACGGTRTTRLPSVFAVGSGAGRQSAPACSLSGEPGACAEPGPGCAGCGHAH